MSLATSPIPNKAKELTAMAEVKARDVLRTLTATDFKDTQYLAAEYRWCDWLDRKAIYWTIYPKANCPEGMHVIPIPQQALDYLSHFNVSNDSNDPNGADQKYVQTQGVFVPPRLVQGKKFYHIQALKRPDNISTMDSHVNGEWFSWSSVMNQYEQILLKESEAEAEAEAEAE